MFTNLPLANVLLTQNSGVIVEQKTIFNYGITDFYGILETLAIDFGVQSKLYIGEFNDIAVVKNDLRQIFLEEQTIFKTSHKGQINTLASCALRFFGKKSTNESLVIKNLRQQINAQKNLREIIMALYQAQGNLSLAAKNIYVHRNTLQYQLEK